MRFPLVFDRKLRIWSEIFDPYRSSFMCKRIFIGLLVPCLGFRAARFFAYTRPSGNLREEMGPGQELSPRMCRNCNYDDASGVCYRNQRCHSTLWSASGTSPAQPSCA